LPFYKYASPDGLSCAFYRYLISARQVGATGGVAHHQLGQGNVREIIVRGIKSAASLKRDIPLTFIPLTKVSLTSGW
jgi:hypothetical protein